MKKAGLITLLAALCIGAFAQAPLKSGKPVMSSDPDGIAPLGVLQTTATLPCGAAYLRASDAKPSVFLLARVGVPSSRGVYVATMSGVHKAGGELVFDRPAKIKAYWGKPSSIPAYGCFFNYKGAVLSFWAESRESLALASYDPDARQLSKIASVKVGGLDGVFGISASELEDGSIEIAAIAGDGSRYRTDRARNESWYDGAMIYKGDISKAGIRKMTLSDPLKGGSFTQASPASFMTALSGAVRLQDSFLGADGYLAVNRFGTLGWQDASSSKCARSWVLDASGRQIEYPANGAAVSLLQFRSGEKRILMGGEGKLVSCRFDGFGEKGPIFSSPSTVLMRGGALYTGSLGVPEVVDWDGDGVQDIICGNSEGRILFFRNTGTDLAPAFSSFAEELCWEDGPVCIRPGYIGVQGPFEAVWGYMCPSVFDWNGDGVPDIVFSDARGKLEVMYARRTPSGTILSRPFALKEDGLEIHGLWRVKPAVGQVSGRVCVVNMAGDGTFHRWWKIDESTLVDDGPLLLRNGTPFTAHSAAVSRDGNYGRVKINLCDWDGDGDLDLILGTPMTSCLPRPDKGIPNGAGLKQLMMQVFYMENTGSDEKPRFADPVGFYVKGKDLLLGVHANGPEPCTIGSASGEYNLLVGCESGRLFWIDRKDLTAFTIKDRYEKK